MQSKSITGCFFGASFLFRQVLGAHAPGERVRLKSVSRFWDLVLKLLSKLSGSALGRSEL